MFRLALIHIINLLVGAYVSAGELPCSTGPGMFLGSGEQQKCIAQVIKGFGGYDWEKCVLTVYLADLNEKEAATEILEPLLRGNKWVRSNCSKTSLDFVGGAYAYNDLLKWHAFAKDIPLLKKSIFEYVSFPMNNRIKIHVGTESTASHVKEVLNNHGVPVGAFLVESNEGERIASDRIQKDKSEKMASIAPIVRLIKSDQRVVVPAVNWEGKQVTELVMGSTGLREALSVLPPWPGHGPSDSHIPRNKRSSWLSKEQHHVLDSIKKSYTPKNTQLILGFNKRKELIFAQYEIVDIFYASRMSSALETTVNLKEVHRDKQRLVKQGVITDCVIVETVSTLQIGDTPDFKLGGMVLFYTCDTENNTE